MAPVLAMLPPHSPNSFWAPCGTRKPPATIRTAGQASQDTLSYRPCKAGIRSVTAASVVETMCAPPPPCRLFPAIRPAGDRRQDIAHFTKIAILAHPWRSYNPDHARPFGPSAAADRAEPAA